jgi:hypothetical protein
MKKSSTKKPKARSRAGIIDIIRAEMDARDLRSVPLSRRFEYSYRDDGEDNDGDIGWLVDSRDSGLVGMDEDMGIGLNHFSISDIADIRASIQWDRGVSREILQERDGNSVSSGEDSARRGSIPPDVEGMNSDRAQWARAALGEFKSCTHQTEDLEALGDLIADLGHLADRLGDSGAVAIERGLRAYRQEIAPA